MIPRVAHLPSLLANKNPTAISGAIAIAALWIGTFSHANAMLASTLTLFILGAMEVAAAHADAKARQTERPQLETDLPRGHRTTPPTP